LLRGFFIVFGGTFTTGNADILVGDGSTGTGVMTVSGDAQVSMSQRFHFGTGSGGTGRLVLDGSVGSGTNIINTRGGSDRFILGANGTLEAVIDQAAIDTPAAMRMVVLTDTNALFESGSLLSMSFDPSATVPETGTWTLVDAATGITDNGIALDTASINAGWSLAIVDGTGSQQFLQATFTIPEPTSAAMLLGGLSLVFLRRRRR